MGLPTINRCTTLACAVTAHLSASSIARDAALAPANGAFGTAAAALPFAPVRFPEAGVKIAVKGARRTQVVHHAAASMLEARYLIIQGIDAVHPSDRSVLTRVDERITETHLVDGETKMIRSWCETFCLAVECLERRQDGRAFLRIDRGRSYHQPSCCLEIMPALRGYSPCDGELHLEALVRNFSTIIGSPTAESFENDNKETTGRPDALPRKTCESLQPILP
jgi:hypothetical protein